MTQTKAVTILDLPTVTERAVLYARVSGNDRGKDNLPGQLELCREYATGNGYSIIAELSEDDRGASGAEIDLPQLNTIREMALAGQIDVIIVRELDRLSRNLAKQLIVEEELSRAGVRVEFVLAEYADTPEGRLQKHIRATIAEYERELIKIRMNRGKRNKIKRGHVSIGRRPPFGYTTQVVDEVNGVVALEIDPEEAKVITLIYDLFILEGLTVDTVTKKLTDRQILSPLDRRPVPGFTKKRPPGNWSRSSVQKILTEPTYMGIWNYGRRREKRNGAPDLIPVPVPVIIPVETFEMAQEKLNRNKGRRGAPAIGKFLLSKRMTCIECGSRMSVQTHRGKDDEETFSYYYCPGHCQRQVITGCTQKYLRQDKMDSLLWNWLESILGDRDLLERELNNIEQRRNSAGIMLKSQVDAAAAKLTELETDLNNTVAILKTLKPGSRSYAVVLEDVNRLEDAIAKVSYQHRQVTGQLEAQALQPEVKNRLLDYAEKLAAGLEEAKEDYELQKAIVAALDVETRLGREDGEIVCYATCFLYDYETELTKSCSGRGQLLRVSLCARLTL